MTIKITRLLWLMIATAADFNVSVRSYDEEGYTGTCAYWKPL